MNKTQTNRHNKSMKKCILIILCVCFCFLAGCESQTAINAAHISDITSAKSTEYGIKVTVDEDKRLEEKYIEIQVKSSNENQSLTLGQELGSTYTIIIPKSDFWYNLSALISKTNGVGTDTEYTPFKEYGSKVFMFSSDEDVKLTFRVVAGDVQQAKSGEKVLTLSESISSEVELDVKKHTEK